VVQARLSMETASRLIQHFWIANFGVEAPQSMRAEVAAYAAAE